MIGEGKSVRIGLSAWLLVAIGVTLLTACSVGEQDMSDQEQASGTIIDNIRLEFQKITPIIEDVVILDSSYDERPGSKYLVLARGVRESRKFGEIFSDELIGLFVVDDSFGVITHTVDIFPITRGSNETIRLSDGASTRRIEISRTGATYLDSTTRVYWTDPPFARLDSGPATDPSPEGDAEAGTYAVRVRLVDRTRNRPLDPGFSIYLRGGDPWEPEPNGAVAAAVVGRARPGSRPVLMVDSGQPAIFAFDPMASVLLRISSEMCPEGCDEDTITVEISDAEVRVTGTAVYVNRGRSHEALFERP